MAFEHRWLVDRRVLYMRFVGDVEPEELAEGVRIHNDMMQQINTDLVHSIMDVSRASAFPSRLGELRRLGRPLLEQSKLDWFIVIGVENPVDTFLAEAFGQLSRKKFRHFRDSQAAFNFLQAMDNLLPSLALDD